MYRKENFLFIGTNEILSETGRTITGRGRGFWNVEEGGTVGKEDRQQVKAPGRPLIRGWQP